MTKEQIRKADTLEMWHKVIKVLLIAWRILVILVMTFWIVAAIVYVGSLFGFNLM